MAEAVLSVEIQAKVDKFVKALLDAANQSQSTENIVGKMSANISNNIANVNKANLSQFNNALKSGELSIQKFGQQATKLPNALPQIVKGSNQAAFALTNLGRVAQDAPFGFIGIQNNLNPLLESFQRLKAETGSTGSALKALGSSLIGPAGIGIALSVVSSAILFYQQYQQKANKATADAKKGTDDYVKSLDSLTAASVVGAQNAQKEITDLRLLFAVYQNVNLPLKERKEAYQQIQKEYPDYFKNIKFEETASNNTKAAYDRLTDSIIATARARAAGDKITQNEKRKLENEQKIIDLQKDQIKNQSELDKSKGRQSVQISGGTGGVSSDISDLTREATAQGKINENLNIRRNIVSDTNKLNEENGRLLNYVNQQIEAGGKITKDNATTTTESTDKKTKSVKSLSDVLSELNQKLIANGAIVGVGITEKAKKDIDDYKNAIEQLVKIDTAKSRDEIDKLNVKILDAKGVVNKAEAIKIFEFELPAQQAKRIEDEKKRTLSNLEKAGAEFESELDKIRRTGIAGQEIFFNSEAAAKENDRFQEYVLGLEGNLKRMQELPFVLDTIGSTLSASFTSVGEAIASGGDIIGAAGQVLQSAFANILSQLGQQFITMGAAKIAAGILASPFGGKLIANGAGLVALGAGLSLGGGIVGGLGKGKNKGGGGGVGGLGKGKNKGGGGGVSAFANGGIISGPTLGLMGEYAGAKSDPEVVAPLSKLKNMLGQTDDSGNVLPNGNNTPVYVQQELSIDGKKLVALIRTVQDTNKRIG